MALSAGSNALRNWKLKMHYLFNVEFKVDMKTYLWSSLFLRIEKYQMVKLKSI